MALPDSRLPTVEPVKTFDQLAKKARRRVCVRVGWGEGSAVNGPPLATRCTPAPAGARRRLQRMPPARARPQMRAGELYVNVHSVRMPAGEARGNLFSA